jgi:alkyl hydroperoxide reductase subunit AhpC
MGYRQMSHTPIPEVADTAAEVADSAAILDEDNMVSDRSVYLGDNL